MSVSNRLVSCMLQVMQAFHRVVPLKLLDLNVTWINVDVQANLYLRTFKKRTIHFVVYLGV
jgi:hypothetical protein